MTYRLHFPADVFVAYKQLPELARRDLALALVDAKQNPIAYSEPYGQDDGIIHTVAQGHVTAVILLGHDASTMTVPTIGAAGFVTRRQRIEDTAWRKALSGRPTGLVAVSERNPLASQPCWL